MLPSLPCFLWEQAQHTASLRLPISCTASAEEHRGYSQPPFPSAFHCTVLKSSLWKVWKFHMPYLMGVWRMTPSFAPVHTTSLCSTFQILPPTLLWHFVCSTGLSQSDCSLSLPCSAHKSLRGCSSGFRQEPWFARNSARLQRAGVFSPPHLLLSFLMHWVLAREGLSRTLF